jgi:hypothetical protein
MNETYNDEGSCCPICLEPLLLRQTTPTEPANETLLIGATVPCGHCFHLNCWKQSFDSASRHQRPNVNNCPTCNVKTKSFMRLYLNAPEKVKPVPAASVATTGNSNLTLNQVHSNGAVLGGTFCFGTSTTVLPLAGSSNPFPLFPVALSNGAQPRSVGSPAQGSPSQQGRRVRLSYAVVRAPPRVAGVAASVNHNREAPPHGFTASRSPGFPGMPVSQSSVRAVRDTPSIDVRRRIVRARRP